MELTPDSALAALLSRDESLSREEPDVAASIGAQLEHMELSSMPLSLRRRVRDVYARTRPRTVCEVGAGIGHLTAWLLEQAVAQGPPVHHDIIEAGGKFGVILQRLVDRFDAGDWAHVKVGEFDAFAAAQASYAAANATTPVEAQSEAPPLNGPYDLMVVDAGPASQADVIRAALPHLAAGGVLLTPEPEVPTEDVGDIPESGPQNAAQARVVAFNAWVELIRERQDTHHIGFVPLYGGTLVGMVQL